MFRRWRRRALVESPPTPEPPRTGPALTGEQVFELLNSRLSDLIGAHGQWTLVRRTDDDTDRIFHAMLTHQIAAELTHEFLSEQQRAHGIEVADWQPAPLVLKPAPLSITDGTIGPEAGETQDEADGRNAA